MIRKRNFNIVILLLSVTIGLAVYVLLWIAITDGPLKKTKIININKNSLFEVAKQLKKQKAINNNVSFFLLAKIANSITTLKAGEYELPAEISIWNIIRIMQSGKFFKRSLTIPEGYTTNQIFSVIEQNQYLLGSVDKQLYQEGMLLPETYFFIRGDTRADILKKMSESMNKTIDEIWQQRDTTIPLKDKSELLILASIVEKEAKIKEEQPLIASVFINRIKKKMKLDSDPTTIYAITKGKYKLKRLLSRADLKIQSPFNTYTTVGLPPTPIANPGIDAIKAVAKPAKTNYLFFVVKNCQGYHSFSPNLKKHNLYVRQYKRLKC
ncbi:MAG: endolytic transglycosylase MltG [Rickettsiales bacterium]|nr:endolytic transglycosylase MltG [Rickettsiales bacterium]